MECQRVPRLLTHPSDFWHFLSCLLIHFTLLEILNTEMTNILTPNIFTVLKVCWMIALGAAIISIKPQVAVSFAVKPLSLCAWECASGARQRSFRCRFRDAYSSSGEFGCWRSDEVFRSQWAIKYSNCTLAEDGREDFEHLLLLQRDKGIAAIKKLTAAAKVSENDAKKCWYTKPFGKFIFLPQNTLLAPNSMRPPKAQSSLSFTWHCGTWPGRKNIQIRFDLRCGQPFQRSWAIDFERLSWSGERFSENLQTRPLKWPQLLQVGPGASSWALSSKRWKNTKQTFDAGAWIFTGTRWSWKDSTAPFTERLFWHQYAVEMHLPEG